MSGVAGGNKITRQDIQDTVKNYTEVVLKKIFPKITDKDIKISGSYISNNEKNEFGDIDLILNLPGKDKIEIKEKIINFIKKLPDDIIVPFKSKKYIGKKYNNAGELISILFPIYNKDGQYVQIDNIISINKAEQDFKLNFLNMPAEIQGLQLGLVTVSILEFGDLILKLLKIKKPKLDGEKLELNLSSSSLSLRQVKLNNFKDRKTIWTSTNFDNVNKIMKLYNIDFNKDFENVVKQIKNRLTHPDSPMRVAGVFRTMISIKSGEQNTPKGDRKQYCLDIVKSYLGSSINENILRKYIKEEIIKYFN